MANVDERVVKIGFDGREFKRGTEETLKAIEKLNAGMSFSDGEKGLRNLASSIKRISFEAIDEGIEQTQKSFNVLSVAAVTALATISHKITNVGLNIAKQLSIGGIVDGFREYELLLNSTQTVLANTSWKGENVNTVNAALDELNTYADKTIYNFGEMTRNIGMFTAAGVDLDMSVSAIKGMSNLAALQGADSASLSRAMYQTSQAMSGEYFRLMDWNSLRNAGMAGERFKKALKLVAEKDGVDVDALIAKSGSFEESLREGWLTTERMSETLSAITGDMDEHALIAKGYSKETAEYLAEMGRTSADAATKIKSFSQLMEVIPEAIGSGWATTFRLLVGDLEQAKEFWTAIGDPITSYIDRVSKARNQVVEEFVNLGGRTNVIEGFKNIFVSLGAVIKTVSESFREFFPRKTGEDLFRWSESFKKFTDQLVVSDQRAKQLRSTFDGVFAIAQLGATILGGIARVAFAVLGQGLKVLREIAGALLGVTSTMGGGVKSVTAWVKEFDLFSKVADAAVVAVKALGTPFILLAKGVRATADAITPHIVRFFTNIADKAPKAAKSLAEFGEEVRLRFAPAIKVMGEWVNHFRGKLEELRSSLYNFGHGAISTLSDLLGGAWDSVSVKMGAMLSSTNGVKLGEGFSISGAMLDGIDAFSNWISKLDVSKMASKVDQFETDVLERLRDTWGNFSEWSGGLTSHLPSLSEVGDFLKKMGEIATGGMRDFAEFSAEKFANGFERIKDAVSSLGEMLAPIGNAIKSFFGWIGGLFSNGEAFDNSLAIANNAVAIYILLQLRDVIKGMGGFGRIIDGLSDGLDQLGNTLKAYQRTLKADALLKIAKAIGILAASVAVLAMVNPDRLWNAVGALGAVSAILAVLTGVMTLLTSKMPGKSSIGDASRLAGMGVAITSMSVAALIIAVALKKLADLDTKDLLVGSAVFAVIMTAMAVITRWVSKPHVLPNNAQQLNFLSSALGMVLVSVAMLQIGRAIERIGGLDRGKLLQGGLAVGAILAVLAAYARFSQGKLTASSSLAVIGIAGGFFILAKVVEKIGQMDPGTLQQGVQVMTVIMAAMAVLVAVTGHKGSSFNAGQGLAYVLIASSLLLIGRAIEKFGEMDKGSIFQGLLVMTAIITGMTVMSAIIGGVKGGGFLQSAGMMLAFAAALNMLMIPIMAFSRMDTSSIQSTLIMLAGLSTIIVGFTGGMALISNVAGPALILTLLSLGAAISLLGAGFALAGAGVSMFAAGLGVLAVTGSAGVAVLITALRQLIGLIPFMADAFARGFVNIIRVIGENAKDISVSMAKIFKEMIRGVRELLPEITGLIGDMMSEILRLIRDKTPEVVDTFLALLDGILRGVVETVPKIVDALLEILSGIRDAIPQFVEVAIEMITAFLGGISSNIQRVIDAGTDILVNIIKGFSDSFSKINGAVADMLGAMANEFDKDGNVTRAKDNGVKLLKNMLNGFLDFGDQVGNAVGDFFLEVANKIKEHSQEGGKGDLIAEAWGEALGGAIRSGFRRVGLLTGGFVDGLFGKTDEASNSRKTGGARNYGGSRGGNTKVSNPVVPFVQASNSSMGMVTNSASLVLDTYGSTINRGMPALGNQMQTSMRALDRPMRVSGASAGGNLARSTMTTSSSSLSRLGANLSPVVASGRNMSQMSAAGASVGQTSGMAIGPALNAGSTSSIKSSNWTGNSARSMTASGLILSLVMNRAGRHAGGGFGPGLLSATANATHGLVPSVRSIGWNAGTAYAGAFVRGARARFSIHSPSREMMEIGRYVNEGFAIGMEERAGRVSDSMALGVNQGLTGIAKALSSASDTLDGVDTDIAIRPILDLDDAMAGARVFEEDLGVSASYSLADQTRVGYNRSQEESARRVDVNFTQNITSPKALSTMEIHRQTKNQVNRVKSLIGGNIL